MKSMFPDVGEIRRANTSDTREGCSNISFFMKCGCFPFSISDKSSVISLIFGSSTFPEMSQTVMLSG